MKMKRFISVFLVVTMICGIFVGCGDTEQNEEVEGGKLKVGIPQRVSVYDYYDNAFTKYVEENTGVEIEFAYFSSTASEYQQQLALMASSNEELPDVLIGFNNLGTRTANAYGEDGYFLELTDLIEKYGNAFNSQYKKLSKRVKEIVDIKMTNLDDGKIYGMPSVGMRQIDSIQSLCFINQTWLDKIGMQQPTTVEELYNVLKAFKTMDPNGNGIADEIPMLGGDMIINYVINAFMYYEQAHPYNIGKDEKVYAPYTTDEFREGLKWLNKMCDEGLYSDLSFSVTANTELKNLYTPATGVATVGIICGHPSNYMNTSSAVMEEYVALRSLSAATEEGGFLVVKDENVMLSAFITKDCKNPNLAMKFIDFFYEDEAMTRARHGEKDVDWKEGSGVDIYGNEVTTVVINEQAFFEGKQTWSATVCGIATPQNVNSVSGEDNIQGQRTGKLLKGSYEMMVKYPVKSDTVRNLAYLSKEEEILEKYEPTIHNYVKEQADLFIMGTIDIESETTWNEYVSQIDELCLKDILKIKQTAYDRMKK